MTTKLYYANVTTDMIGYFEDKIEERNDKICILSKRKIGVSDDNEYVRYILAAEDGVIDPKWRLFNRAI